MAGQTQDSPAGIFQEMLGADDTQADGTRIVVLAGSPHGAMSGMVAEILVGLLQARGAQVSLLRINDFDIAGCTGCGACARSGICVHDRAEAAGVYPGHAALRNELEDADGLALVAPVYFSGPPSQLKAVIDRMQPLFYQRYLTHARAILPVSARKPLDLFVVGHGGDPFGYQPLVTCVHSGFRMLDYELRRVHNLVGVQNGVPDGSTYTLAADADMLSKMNDWACDLVSAALARKQTIDPREV